MANKELYSIIQRVKKGEKAEDIIDFSRESIDGYTPEKALEFVKEVTICKFCEKPLTENEMFVCKDCLKNQNELFSKLSPKDNDWTWTLGLIIVAGLFGFGKDNNNNDNNDKDKEN